MATTLLRPRVFFPPLANKRWSAFNLNELAIADNTDPGKPNRYLDPGWLEERLHREAKARGVDYFYDDCFMQLRDVAWRGHYHDPARMRHTGFDLWAPAETAVLMPRAGEVIRTLDDPEGGGWGGCIFFKLEAPYEGADYMIIAHLSPSWLPAVGKRFGEKDQVGRIGRAYENGG